LKRTRDNFHNAVDEFWKNGQRKNADASLHMIKKGRRQDNNGKTKEISEQDVPSKTHTDQSKKLETNQDALPHKSNDEESPRAEKVDSEAADDVEDNDGAVTTRSGRTVRLPAYRRK
jgi:hypothetical protein